jgi:hypothetical protein
MNSSGCIQAVVPRVLHLVTGCQSDFGGVQLLDCATSGAACVARSNCVSAATQCTHTGRHGVSQAARTVPLQMHRCCKATVGKVAANRLVQPSWAECNMFT